MAALIDMILFRGPEERAKAEAMREFKRAMPFRGKFSEFQESGITSYYNKRFGQFKPELDTWKSGEASALRANPQLRRMDVIADSMFNTGGFTLRMAGDIHSMGSEPRYEGTIAVVSLHDRAGKVSGMLTLDIAEEIRFTKLRIGITGRTDFVVRLSMLDQGIVILPNTPTPGQLPESVHESAPQGSDVYTTLKDALAAIELILQGKRV